MNDLAIEKSNGILKFIPLRWSSLHYTLNSGASVALRVKCEIFTRALTIPYLDPKRVRRLELLTELHNQGVSDRQISNLFNFVDLRTPQGKPYSPNNIWMTREKWNLRKIRENDTYFVIYPPCFLRIKRNEK